MVEAILIGDILGKACWRRIVVKHIFDIQHIQEEVQDEWRVPQAFLLDALQQFLERSLASWIQLASRESLLELHDVPLLNIEVRGQGEGRRGNRGGRV